MSPSPEWYEPADLVDCDDDPAPESWPLETLVVVAGAVSWACTPDDDD